jgi:hypothetical protein
MHVAGVRVARSRSPKVLVVQAEEVGFEPTIPEIWRWPLHAALTAKSGF